MQLYNAPLGQARTMQWRTLGIVDNVGDGESLTELEPGASSTVDGSMTGLQLIDCQSDIGSYELFAKECLRLEQFTQIRAGGAAHAARRKAAIHHHSCDQDGPVRKRASTEPEWLRAMQCPCRSVQCKAKCVKDKGKREQCWYLNDNLMLTARWKEDNTCSNCQRNGDVKRLCRVRAKDLRKKANAKKHPCS